MAHLGLVFITWHLVRAKAIFCHFYGLSHFSLFATLKSRLETVGGGIIKVHQGSFYSRLIHSVRLAALPGFFVSPQGRKSCEPHPKQAKLAWKSNNMIHASQDIYSYTEIKAWDQINILLCISCGSKLK